jgi:DNA polymerase-3 subunit gamma/tau
LSNAQVNKEQSDAENSVQSEQKIETEQDQPNLEPEVDQQVEEPKEDGITLESVWEKIKSNVQELGPRINQALQAADPKQIDDNTIKLHITAESHKDLYEKHKKSIYDVLSVELGIKNLILTFEMVKSDLEDKRPLKDEEKYQKMVEDNPALQLLKDKFNLDLKK